VLTNILMYLLIHTHNCTVYTCISYKEDLKFTKFVSKLFSEESYSTHYVTFYIILYNYLCMLVIK